MPIIGGSIVAVSDICSVAIVGKVGIGLDQSKLEQFAEKKNYKPAGDAITNGLGRRAE